MLTWLQMRMAWNISHYNDIGIMKSTSSQPATNIGISW